MKRAYDQVFSVSQAQGLSLRDAALTLAVQRVARAMELRGVYS